jgi:hypothetical protein
MGEVVHTSKIRIVREKGPTRRAMIEGFAVYLVRRPAAQSVIGCIDIRDELALEYLPV